MAQERNLYPCGHYATEVFGVKALASEVARKFHLGGIHRTALFARSDKTVKILRSRFAIHLQHNYLKVDEKNG